MDCEVSRSARSQVSAMIAVLCNWHVTKLKMKAERLLARSWDPVQTNKAKKTISVHTWWTRP